jgi:hypothetical protein
MPRTIVLPHQYVKVHVNFSRHYYYDIQLYVHQLWPGLLENVCESVIIESQQVTTDCLVAVAEQKH